MRRHVTCYSYKWHLDTHEAYIFHHYIYISIVWISISLLWPSYLEYVWEAFFLPIECNNTRLSFCSLGKCKNPNKVLIIRVSVKENYWRGEVWMAVFGSNGNELGDISWRGMRKSGMLITVWWKIKVEALNGDM